MIYLDTIKAFVTSLATCNTETSIGCDEYLEKSLLAHSLRMFRQRVITAAADIALYALLFSHTGRPCFYVLLFLFTTTS
jgi:hypothetical protein